MQFGEYTITAPLMLGGEYSEAEMLGASVWLWMHSPSHRNAPLHTLPVVMLPAITNQQFILISKETKPVFYLSFAWLNEEAEHRYLTSPFVMMQAEDWRSGDRLWFFDLISPFGDLKLFIKIVLDMVFPDHFGRFLRHEGDARGILAKNWYGCNVDKKEARKWLAQRPLAASIPLAKE